MNKTLILILAFIMVSCVRENEEAELWNNDNTLVVFSALTPGKTSKVYFYRKNTISSEASLSKVYISDNVGNEVELTRFDSVFIDTANRLQITKGRAYYLKIDNGNGSPLVTASTVIPDYGVDFSEFLFQTIDSSDYYMNRAYFKGKWFSTSTELSMYTYWVKTSWGWFLDINKNSDGSYQVIKSQLEYPKGNVDNYISLLTTDEILSNYLLNKKFQNASYSESMDLFNVILSEFSGTLPNFSNIVNGAGVFGSYIIHSRDLKGNVIQLSSSGIGVTK